MQKKAPIANNVGGVYAGYQNITPQNYLQFTSP